MCKNIKYANSTHKNYLLNFIKITSILFKVIIKNHLFFMLRIVSKTKSIKISDITHNKNIYLLMNKNCVLKNKYYCYNK